MKMDWSKDHVLQLIELVRRRPCLYNVEHESFLNKKERIRAASDLAKTISHTRPGTTIEEVLKKWDELCAQFLSKHEHILQSRRGTVSRPFYYDKMSFVLDYISPKPSPKLLLEKREDKEKSTLKCLFEKMTWSQSGQLFMPRLRLAVLTSQFSTRRFSPRRIAAPFFSPRLLQPGPYSRASTMGISQSTQSSASVGTRPPTPMVRPATRSLTPVPRPPLTPAPTSSSTPETGSPPSLWLRRLGNSSARLSRRHGSACFPRPPRVRGARRRCFTLPSPTRGGTVLRHSTEDSGDASPLTTSDKLEPVNDDAAKGGSLRNRRVLESTRAVGKSRPSSKQIVRDCKDVVLADEHVVLPVKEKIPSQQSPPAEPASPKLKARPGMPLGGSDEESVSCFSFQTPQIDSSGGSLPSQKRGTSDAVLSSAFASSRDRSCSSAQDIQADGRRDDDEDTLYMKYVLCRLKKLDEAKKVKLKFEIDKLFYQVLASR